MSTLYVNNIEPVSGSSLTLISASLVSVDNLSVTSLTSSFQGDLAGTASFAVTASHALNSTSAAGTEGQVQFNSGSEFGADSNLFWDNTNKRLGVGTNTPTSTIHAIGADNTSARSVQIANQQGSGIFSVANDRVVQIGDYTASGYQSTLTFLRASGGSRGATFNQGNNDLILTNPNGGFLVNGLQTTLKGYGSTSATTSLLVQNSSGTDLMKITDDGKSVFSGVGVDMNTNGMRLQNTAGTATYVNIQPTTSYLNTQVFRFFNTRVNVGSSALPDDSSVLQADSTTKGFLPPRMTTTQKNAISSPAAGLMVYDTDTNKLCCYNGTSWNDLF